MNAERAPLAENLRAGLMELTAAVTDLSPAQWVWPPPDGGWSIAQCCEHVHLTEKAILGQLATAGPEGLDQTAGKDEFIVRAVTSRRRKVPAPGNMIPTDIPASPADFLEAFATTRHQAVSTAEDGAIDLRGICAPHFALQQLDGYQWLLMTATHVRRHLLQIEEIKQAPGFPPA